jgi:1-acyl-sn-glycerol-3-phosphate acyltransferase
MLTQIVHPILRLALWVFFRDIDVRGRDTVPLDGPLIYVANHPNVMMDPLIVGLNTPGQIPHFLGKGTLFSYPLFAWFLRRSG